jgi:NAD(P)-dependent dehydrogenase (short-subunit alcohol dehydrogenase family)
MRLEGKTALITGGATGIGFAAAEAFVKEGAFVCIIGRREYKLQEACAKLGDNSMYYAGDVARKEDMEAAVKKLTAAREQVDIVFCNAGVGNRKRIEDIDKNEFERVMNTEILGSYYTVQACLPHMKEGSVILLNTSVTVSLGLPNFSLYIAAKSAVKSFIHTWTAELRDRKIRVNAIAPGVIPTDAAGRELGRSEKEEKELQVYRGTLIPAGHVGNVKDIAQAAVYLSSDEAAYVNGTELLVDGGLAAIYPVKL